MFISNSDRIQNANFYFNRPTRLPHFIKKRIIYTTCFYNNYLREQKWNFTVIAFSAILQICDFRDFHLNGSWPFYLKIIKIQKWRMHKYQGNNPSNQELPTPFSCSNRLSMFLPSPTTALFLSITPMCLSPIALREEIPSCQMELKSLTRLQTPKANKFKLSPKKRLKICPKEA